MTIARRELKVKVVDQANAVGLTSIEGSFFLVSATKTDYTELLGQRARRVSDSDSISSFPINVSPNHNVRQALRNVLL